MVFGFGRNPDKLEQRAIAYEQKGKTAKAIKCREKAAKLRSQGAGNTGAYSSGPMYTTTSTTTTNTGGSTPFATTRTPQQYEQRALKWEQRNNMQKAQKNREKVWRLQNPQYGPQYSAPQFYNQNKFVGYNVPYTATPNQGMQGGMMQGGMQGGMMQGGMQGGMMQGGMQGGMMQGGMQGTCTSQVMPAVVETHVHPTIVQQTSRPEKIVEVQPVVHRQIDAPQVHVIEKHMYETVPSTGPNVITKGAIVEETVRPRIIEEIQPVVHREVPAPFLERVEQHVTEHIVQPTTTTKQVLNDTTVRPVGLAAGGPMQQTTQTTTTTTSQPLTGMNAGMNTNTGLNSGTNTGRRL